MFMPNPFGIRLVEARVERFKAAFNPKEPITFGPLNAIIGRNGAGKSTVLEAIQWVDTAMRSDIRVACERYNTVHDLINYRSSGKNRNFKITLKWDVTEYSLSSPSSLEYSVKIGEGEDKLTAILKEENLVFYPDSRTPSDKINLISTDAKGERRLSFGAGEFLSVPTTKDRLMLVTLFSLMVPAELSYDIEALEYFWSDAVFLRLSPNEMAKFSDSTRSSYAPILDESGRNLPILLKDFGKEQMNDLINAIQKSLRDMSGIEVSKPIMPQGERYFSLAEQMPSPGPTGKKRAKIPAWMLSEGTRRLTAILALLQVDPPPSFICIEEIENGLDPWTVISVIHHLRSASQNGSQIVFTTHSPWLLDHLQYEEILHVERQDGETVYSRFADLEAVKAYKGRVPPGSVYATEG